ncbi:DUF6082 family protein [Streptomyces sp. NPDC048442]|uniref:DUF6082 family protein n=1 Tax=Streptomyces sp. NPDC048442 TaxID=3154823 RepID=UPI00344208F1
MSLSVLILAGAIGAAAAVHTAQRQWHHRQTTAQRQQHHRQAMKMALHKVHNDILLTAMTHPDLDPVWERVHPKYVHAGESGPLLMHQAWLEHWRYGLDVGEYTTEALRLNARHFMKDPLGLKAWGLTRHGRAQQAHVGAKRTHVGLLDAAYVEAGGPSAYPELERPTSV